jgi:hypothetical protein
MARLDVIENSRNLNDLEKGAELDSLQSTGVQACEVNEIKPSPVGDVSTPTKSSQYPIDAVVDELDTVVVGWEGTDDPENPKCWPSKKKIFNVTIISAMTFLCPLCSAIFVQFPLTDLIQVSRSSANSGRVSYFSDAFSLFRLGVSLRLWRRSSHPRTSQRNIRQKTYLCRRILSVYINANCLCSIHQYQNVDRISLRLRPVWQRKYFERRGNYK